MKIITWNCNMAFRKKADLVLKQNPDILIVQECEHPAKLHFSDGTSKPKDFLWFGKNKNKGLGIFSYSDFKLKLHKSHNEELRLVIPIKISGAKIKFILYAIWAHNPDDPEGHYITQVWKALNYYKRHISKRNTILIGDFNSNTIWDRPRRVDSHSKVVEHLRSKEIYSVYHKHFAQEQGKEIHPTLYMYRHKDKPYHVDYCFASVNLLENLTSVEIGEFDAWRNYSDHVPLIVQFNLADV